MKATSKENSSRWTKTQLVVFFVLVLLSVDEINPVKVLVHVFPSLRPWHVSFLSIITMIFIFISDVKNMTYYFLKIFFHSILSIFFRSVDIVGRENIPSHGPVLFTINHANQFMDAVMVVCSCPHNVGYLMAEASFNRRVIGDIAWALGVVPVRRAQDNATKGTGMIQLQAPIPATKTTAILDSEANKVSQKLDDEINNSPSKSVVDSKKEDEDTVDRAVVDSAEEDHVDYVIRVIGTNTQFMQELQTGDKIRPPGTAFGLRVRSIESETSMIVDGNDLPSDFPVTLFDSEDRVPFHLLKHTPLDKVFEKVLDRFAAGGAVGIFPEGGSHDRTDLLPLKVGISLIAYSALEKDGIVVPVVPVGLNYFRAHRWRGRAVIEYGKPITIDPNTLDDFKSGGFKRHHVCNEFLEKVEDSMRSVIVSAPDYETLELIHTARRLYQNRREPLDSQTKQDLSRRFVEGYRRLLLLHDGKLPQEWLDLQNRIKDYRNELKELGLKDYQVISLLEEHLEKMDVRRADADLVLSNMQVPYHVLHFIIVLCIAAIPFILLNLPVRIMAGMYAERRRRKALENSKVKLRGYDVMLTEKVLFCIIMVPTLWVTYGVLLRCFTNFDGPTIAVILGAFPLFAYTGIIVADAGMVDLQDLRPYMMRLFPSKRRQLAALPHKRKRLQEDLRLFIKTMGPQFGEIYYGKNVDWQQQMRRVDSKESSLAETEMKKLK